MGACGCGDFAPDFRLPIPGSGVWTIQIYGGCEDCHEGPGAVIQWYGRASLFYADAKDLPLLPCRCEDAEGGFKELAVPVIDPRALTDAIAERYGSGPALDVAYGASGLAEDIGDDVGLLRDAVSATVRRFKEAT